MRYQPVLIRILTLLLGFNLLAGSASAAQLLGEISNTASQISTVPSHAAEPCHDMTDTAAAKTTSQSELTDSCCADACDCDGATCGGTGLPGETPRADWGVEYAHAMFLASLYLSVSDGPQSPPPILVSI